MTRSEPDRSSRSTTPGSDFLALDPADAPVRGLTDWLTARLRRAIDEGALAPGARLPATRTLAADLRISRGVVSEAYRRLGEDGRVTGNGRGGTRVTTPLGPDRHRRAAVETAHAPRPVRLTPPTPAQVFAATPATRSIDDLRGLPARIDLAPGVPDLAAFPRSAWLRAERTVLGSMTPAEFGYADPRGALAFRTAVAAWLARTRGIAVDPDRVVVVSGVAQALALVAQVLRRTGIDRIAVEDPGSLGARDQLAAWGITIPPIPVDANGLSVADLRASDAPAVLVTPAHQFPTGVILGGERRAELLAWARAGGLIVEDDYDAEHRYDRPPVPALRSLAPDRVCYTGSVSKLLAPALRIGWLLVPDRYLDAVVAAKRNADLGSGVLPQLVLADLMRSGELERHLRVLRRRHRARRDAMIRAIEEFLPGAWIHGAAAGLHLTVTFDNRGNQGNREGDEPSGALDDSALAAAALELGVKAHPLSWHARLAYRPGLVLGYAARTPTEIREAVGILGRAAGQSGVRLG